ncbi:hypothetical protein M0802_000411 [Mischocyttarus mexicanus]|nr:hypothetical protein M0802_000411 [Mischocyttarus mexicanus]
MKYTNARRIFHSTLSFNPLTKDDGDCGDGDGGGGGTAAATGVREYTCIRTYKKRDKSSSSSSNSSNSNSSSNIAQHIQQVG